MTETITADEARVAQGVRRRVTARAYTDARGEWRVSIVASNGEALFVSSESYLRLRDALRALDLAAGVRAERHAPHAYARHDERYDVRLLIEGVDDETPWARYRA